MKRLHLTALLLLLLIPAAARAADEYVDLYCWAPITITIGGTGYSVPPTNRSSGITWAEPALDQTDPVGGTATQSLGFEFPNGTRKEIQCTVILPADYDTGGSTPQVTLEGWGIDDTSCGPGDPGLPVNFTFEVSSRSYAAGETANAAWSTASSGSMGTYCPYFVQSKDVVKSLTLDATTSASEWSANELVFFRIARVSNDSFTQPFHLSRVRLRLPE